MEENEELKEAVEKLDSLSADERMQKIADLREKAIMDEKAIYARGKEIGAREIAKLMLKVDMEIEQIKEITGLTEEEIEKIDDLSKEERKKRMEQLREKAIMDEKAIYARGKEIRAREIAKLMLKVDMEIEQIKEITGLTEEEIEKVDDLSKEERKERMEKLREKAILDEKAIYARGEEVRAREIAKLMLKVDMEIEQIKEITGLTEEEIEKVDDLSKEERKERMEQLREKAIMDEKAIYARGLDVGVERNKIEIAKNMLKKNMQIEDISEITGLTTEEIEKLK